MMPEMQEMKKASDEFLAKAEEVLETIKEQQESEDEQD